MNDEGKEKEYNVLPPFCLYEQQPFVQFIVILTKQRDGSKAFVAHLTIVYFLLNETNMKSIWYKI